MCSRGGHEAISSFGPFPLSYTILHCAMPGNEVDVFVNNGVEGGNTALRQHADAPTCKRRRLRVKQPCAALSPPPCLLPVSTSVWGSRDEGKFDELSHRRKYLFVYNKFTWWFRSNPVVQFDSHSHCSEELWRLACKELQSLNKRQKTLIVRQFLKCTCAPLWIFEVCAFAVTRECR